MTLLSMEFEWEHFCQNGLIAQLDSERMFTELELTWLLSLNLFEFSPTWKLCLATAIHNFK